MVENPGQMVASGEIELRKLAPGPYIGQQIDDGVFAISGGLSSDPSRTSKCGAGGFDTC
jgi:hypothetical protein